MTVLESLKTEFPPIPPALTDEYIEHNHDPMSVDSENSWLEVMPAYMSWCIRSPLRNEQLVLDHTVSAIAEFGRHTQAEPTHLNFWFLCNARQREVVAAFLRWCLNAEALVQEEQVVRSLKRWQGT